jgi:hypothetical protein
LNVHELAPRQYGLPILKESLLTFPVDGEFLVVSMDPCLLLAVWDLLEELEVVV